MRVASLALKYELPCTFYWPVEWHSLAYDNGYEPLTYEQAKLIANQFEVGSHTITHRHLTKLDPLEARIEIAESQQILREMFNQRIEKFCPPRGYINTELTLFASQFYKEMRLTKGPNLVHVHPDSGANGNVPWLDVAEQKDDLHLWMHSWELDKYNEWDNLEDFLDLYCKQQ
jgi:peptidoglycan/xylan/chitin deacetylase (PgdA/CDA1 family)